MVSLMRRSSLFRPLQPLLSLRDQAQPLLNQLRRHWQAPLLWMNGRRRLRQRLRLLGQRRWLLLGS